MSYSLTKSFSGGFKDADSLKGIVSGYLNSFNTKDSDGDISAAGSFTKTIQENGPDATARIKYLQDHDTKKVVGKFLVLKEDNFGLYYEAKIGRDTKGRDYLLMVEDGIITEHSIGYKVMKEKKVDDTTNLITEYKLYEGSGLQFWGANQYTPITGLKSESDISLTIDLLEKALRNANYTDETFKTIIIPKLEGLKSLILPITEPIKTITLPTPEEMKLALKAGFLN